MLIYFADINECSDKTLCTGEHEECENLPGSHECVCQKGYSMSEGSCQPIPEGNGNMQTYVDQCFGIVL